MVQSHFLNHGSCFNLTPASDGVDMLHVVVGTGRGCTLESDAALGGVWIPVRGRLRLGTASTDTIMPGELMSTEAEPGLRAIGRGNALWIALLGTCGAWHRALAEVIEIPVPAPMLLPARLRADIATRRHAVELARAASGARAEAVASALVERVVSLQKVFDGSIERCPGRSLAQRRQVFLRLQRVRNYIAANCHRDLENEELARLAQYSPWQFIRAFRTAFAQTPHAFVVDQRLRRARHLLAASTLSIAEVAAACGFEDRCAFSRLFSERFSVTAREFRRGTNTLNAAVEKPGQIASRNFGNAA